MYKNDQYKFVAALLTTAILLGLLREQWLPGSESKERTERLVAQQWRTIFDEMLAVMGGVD